MNTHRIASALGALLFAGALTATAQTNPPAAAAPAAPDAKPKAKADAIFPDEVIVKAKGFQITRSELDDAVLSIKRGLAAQNRTLSAEESAMAERQVLDRLIQVNLLLQKATDADKAKAKELADKRVSDAKARASSEESFKRQLLVTGLDEAKLRAKMTEEATAEQVLVRELSITISDDQVRKYYDDNPSRFEQPEMIRAAHILIATRDIQANLELSEDQKKEKLKLAEDVLKKAKDGEDFGKLAKQYSDDPGSKDKGGEYTFPRGQMVPTFEAAAFALKTNEVSAIVTTPFGYHIIKCYERIPAKKVDLEKVSADLKQYLSVQEIQKLLPDYSKKIRDEAKVQILDDNLKLVEPADAPGTKPSTPDDSKKDAKDAKPASK